jgi:Helix-turn-helix domain of resolvase
VKFGRRPKLTKHQQAVALGRIAQGETLMEIARSYNLSHMTISRLGLLTMKQDNNYATEHSRWHEGLSWLSLCCSF